MSSFAIMSAISHIPASKNLASFNLTRAKRSNKFISLPSLICEMYHYNMGTFLLYDVINLSMTLIPAKGNFVLASIVIVRRARFVYFLGMAQPPTQEKLTRIAIVSSDKCKPKKCKQECKKSCPVNRMGNEILWMLLFFV